jgi:hypothetical protein
VTPARSLAHLRRSREHRERLKRWLRLSIPATTSCWRLRGTGSPLPSSRKTGSAGVIALNGPLWDTARALLTSEGLSVGREPLRLAPVLPPQCEIAAPLRLSEDSGSGAGGELLRRRLGRQTICMPQASLDFYGTCAQIIVVSWLVIIVETDVIRSAGERNVRLTRVVAVVFGLASIYAILACLLALVRGRSISTVNNTVIFVSTAYVVLMALSALTYTAWRKAGRR